MEENKKPLCVDLDGALILTDVLIESALALVKKNPLFLIQMLLWLIKGKAYLKHQIADRVDLDVSLLPYNGPLIDYLKREKASGLRLVLATASNIRYAKTIAYHLGLFDEILASDSSTNLSGSRKRDRLVASYGEGGFSYAANSRVDLSIWESANSAILINVPKRVERQIRKTIPVTHTFNTPRPTIRTYLKAMRLHQWVKNVLVFMPLLAAHQWSNQQMLVHASVAFLVFGLVASSVYLLNDLFDLESDRKHSKKRRRPFAAGEISLMHGIFLVPILIIMAIMLSLTLPMMFMAVVGTYFAVTLAYSLRLKQYVLVDVLVLAALYTIRVIAGGEATDIDVSFWLLAFSMFFFLSLAMVKRYSELLLVEAGKTKICIRTWLSGK